MAYHPRIECENLANFTTTRTRNCELWFVGNQGLEKAILGSLAKCQARHGVKLYAFALEGTHKHEMALFPHCNRADFFRDFNADVARAVPRFCKKHKGGNLWARRYSNEFVPRNEDIEAEFFYTVLQPVQDGLVESIDLYPWYNCFYDAIRGIERSFPVVDWTKYNSDKRWKKNIDISEYTTWHELQYEKRLPGYEDMPQKEYEELMIKKLRKRTKEIVKARRAAGKGFLGRKNLLRVVEGSRAKNPKLSTRWSHRPRVLCSCSETYKNMMKWYFDMLYRFYDASYSYRIDGFNESNFPPGMYKPPNFTVSYRMTHEDLAH